MLGRGGGIDILLTPGRRSRLTTSCLFFCPKPCQKGCKTLVKCNRVPQNMFFFSLIENLKKNTLLFFHLKSAVSVCSLYDNFAMCLSGVTKESS